MKKSRFTDSQIMDALKRVEAGAGYCQIAEWMVATQNRKTTYMGVKKTVVI